MSVKAIHSKETQTPPKYPSKGLLRAMLSAKIHAWATSPFFPLTLYLPMISNRVLPTPVPTAGASSSDEGEPARSTQDTPPPIVRTYDLFSSNERAQALPLGARNPQGTLCHLNAWIALIQTNPYLWNLYSESLSKVLTTEMKGDAILSNAGALNRYLFGKIESQRQQDVSETIGKFFEKFPSHSSFTQITTSLYKKAEFIPDQNIEQELKSRQAVYQKDKEGFFAIFKEEVHSSLPILGVSPSPSKRKNLSEVLYEKWIALQRPKGDVEKISMPYAGEPTPALVLEATSVQFKNAPPALIFSAERTDASQNKNMGEIDLPEGMMISRELFSSKADTAYQLRGFIVHLSAKRDNGTYSSLDGHYISYVKIKGTDENSHYYRLNDATKIGADNREVLTDDHQKEISKEEFLEAGKQFTVAIYNKLDVKTH